MLQKKLLLPSLLSGAACLLSLTGCIPQTGAQYVSYNAEQARAIIAQVLGATDPELNSANAVELLLGTMAQESQFGKFFYQLDGGPARGAFQMEPETFGWLQFKYGERYPYIQGKNAVEMGTDFRLAVIMARLRYRVVPLPLPDPADVVAMAEYWKRWYNTSRGAGKPAEFVENYHRYVKGATA
jgi:hypothetical protein